MQPTAPNCAKCSFKPDERVCRTEGGKHPDNCPTIQKADLIEVARTEYHKKDIAEFARQASLQERDGYRNRELGYARVRPDKPRIEETLEFIGKMGYKKVGLAFCLGLRNEAMRVERFFSDHGVNMVSVICKVGRVPKEELGLTDQDKISICTFETMCNPILQAQVLNSEKTEFNILLGLCVGHDSLFLKYAEAPCTILAVKDRVTGHNPLAALYTLDSYYRALK